MKTVLTQLIDEKNIIIGFSEPTVDPETSKPAINALLLDAPEATVVADKKNLITAKYKLATDAYNIAQSAHRIAMQAEEDSKTAKTPGEKAIFMATYSNRIAARDVKNNEYQNHITLANAIIDEELKPALDALGAAQKELWQSDNVVYFEPKQGEFIITEPEHEALTAQYPIPSGKALEFDGADNSGAIIDDLKGIKYWIDTDGVWASNLVTSIGDSLPVGAISEADLTTAQREAIELQLKTERVAGLTVAEKDAEKLAAINYATAQSVQLRSQYEIKGAADPLADAQDWLAAEIVKIEAKYA